MAIFEPHPRNYYDDIFETTTATTTITTAITDFNTLDNVFIGGPGITFKQDPTAEFDEYFKGTEYENYVFFDIEKMRSATIIGILTFNETEAYLFGINNWCIENEIALPRVHVSDYYIGSEKIAFGFKTKEDLVRFELRWM